MMTAHQLRNIAHDSLSLSESPLLKHYKRGQFRVWNGVAMTGSELPGAGFNFAACLGDVPSFAELLPIATEFFADAKDGWGILVEGDVGHPMEAELKQQGWTVAEDEPAFVLESWTPVTPSVEGLKIRKAVTEVDRDAYHTITMKAFGAPLELAELFVPSLSFVQDPEIAMFIGTVAGEDVATIGYNVAGKTAVVWGTATLETHRGKGYGAALIQQALNDAWQTGCTTASLRSGPLSIPLYERLGFRYVCQHRTYAKAPG